MVHENLKKIRLSKGVTQAHLARKLKVSEMTYYRMESGETKIDVERLRSLANALEVEIVVFFDDKLTDSVTNEPDKKRSVV